MSESFFVTCPWGSGDAVSLLWTEARTFYPSAMQNTGEQDQPIHDALRGYKQFRLNKYSHSSIAVTSENVLSSQILVGAVEL